MRMRLAVTACGGSQREIEKAPDAKFAQELLHVLIVASVRKQAYAITVFPDLF